MTAYPAWTPAARPGIVPLHPLGFGTILGRSFSALRHNPRVLLGFALGVQVVAYLLLIVGIGAVAWASFSRLDTVRPGTDDFSTVMAGSIALTAVTGFVLGLAAGALGVVVQGVVVSEVVSAVLAEKLSLGTLWRRVKPVAWRLVGYSLLLTLAVLVVVAIVGGALFALGSVALPVAIGLGVILALGAIPLWLWIYTKLLLVQAIIIVEHARLGAAVARSWRLIRGRFWPALGVTVIVGVVFGFVAQVISIPFSFVSTGLSTLFSPTGSPNASAVIAVVVSGLITQAVTLAIQAVSLVVQSTAAALIYIDCRMRREGLDLDLQSYVERRDAGAQGLPDPYREHIGREISPRPAVGGYDGYPPPGYAPAGYPVQPGYAPQHGYAPRPGYAPQPGYPQPAYPQPGYAPQPGTPAPPPYAPPATAAQPPAPPAAEPQHPAPPVPPEPTRWAAPGAAEPGDPESPWS